MEEIISNPNFMNAVAVCILVNVIFFRAYTWFRNGGLYYKQHPVAASMDRMKKTGNLSGKDIQSAMMSVDTSKSGVEQVKAFESAIDGQK